MLNAPLKKAISKLKEEQTQRRNLLNSLRSEAKTHLTNQYYFSAQNLCEKKISISVKDPATPEILSKAFFHGGTFDEASDAMSDFSMRMKDICIFNPAFHILII